MENNKDVDEGNIPGEILKSLKQRVASGYMFFVVVSFISLNWKDILIIIKSKDNVYLVVNEVFQPLNIYGFHMWAWAFHFALPLILGVLISVSSSFLNFFVVFLTTWPNKMVRRNQSESLLNIKDELSASRIELDAVKLSLAAEKRERDRISKENLKVLSEAGKLSNANNLIFDKIKEMLSFYVGYGRIKSQDELVKFISALSDSEYAKDDDFYNAIKEISQDLKNHGFSN